MLIRMELSRESSLVFHDQLMAADLIVSAVASVVMKPWCDTGTGWLVCVHVFVCGCRREL